MALPGALEREASSEVPRTYVMSNMPFGSLSMA